MQCDIYMCIYEYIAKYPAISTGKQYILMCLETTRSQKLLRLLGARRQTDEYETSCVFGVNEYVSISIYTCMYIATDTYICTHIYIYVYMHIYICIEHLIYTYICTYIYI